MFLTKRYIVFFLSIIFALSVVIFVPEIVQATGWNDARSAHFIIVYSDKKDIAWAQKVLRQAEKYYDAVASKIGYSRYSNFWTWEDRARIIVYPSQEMFFLETGLPAWSSGGSFRDRNLFQTRTILTYRQETEFLSGVLPHEIGHLLLKDFIGFDKKLPLWFEEGVAQLAEEGKVKVANTIMRNYVKRNSSIPFAIIMNKDIRNEKEAERVGIFYAQSVSMIDFLIRRYGSIKFGQLCKYLKESGNFQNAFQRTYGSSMGGTLEAFEKKWLRYMKN